MSTFEESLKLFEKSAVHSTPYLKDLDTAVKVLASVLPEVPSAA
jgi:hypothetical protein